MKRPKARRQASQRGSLVVVGVGINGPPQTTLEAAECIRQADQVFYVVPDPLTAYWIRRLNPTATTLHDLYAEGKNRYVTYQQMTARIVSAVRAGARVCAVYYGHPGVLVLASHWAISRVRRLGFSARMAPGVSSEGCLWADLGVNPGQHGVQSYEATDFLSSRRRIDPTSNLVLWQVGVLGEPSVRKGMRGRPARIARLVARLRKQYPADHKVNIYQASTLAGSPPRVKRLRLDRLPHVKIFSGATVYIPPIEQRDPDWSVLRWYGQA